MKKIQHILSICTLSFGLLFLAGCQRNVDDLEEASFSRNPNVFINTFSPGLEYAAFGGSVPTAFQVDTEVTKDNISEASMRFEVPDVNDPRGAYAGGAFFVTDGRNLTANDALTFWIRGSQAANIDVIGFGNDLGESRYQVSVSGLPINSNWQKVVIPIPDPSKLRAERGLLFYSEGPEDGRGYTFWIDEVKFERLGTLANPRARINNGQESSVNAEIGENIQLTGFQSIYNLPTGIDRITDIAPGYLDFISSDTSVATVNSNGLINVKGIGTATITAKMRNIDASGAFTVSTTGEAFGPQVAASLPTIPANRVISMFSNAYNNVPIDTWNTRWEFSTAEEFFITVQGSDVIRYRNLNFVGIEFASQTIDASTMTHFHIDIWTPDNTNPPNNFKILLVDFGPDGVFGGGDDSSHEITIARPTLVSDQWVRIDVPLSQFTGLQNRSNMAQLVLSGDLPNVFIDNVLFYNDGTGGGGGGQTSPQSPAPTPSANAADVISIFSDAYTNVPGTDFNPNWGQATVVTQVNIGGSNTLRYGNLNYQGTQLASNVDVSGMQFLHLDFWTANSTALEVFLISPGPVETPVKLEVPTSGWNSIDIPLSSFAPVDLNNVFQFKFEGNGTVYLDNIYFRR